MASKSDDSVVSGKHQAAVRVSVWQKLSKRWVVAGVIVVIVVAGGGWLLMHRHKAAPVSNVPQLSGDALSNAVNKKLGAYNYIGAVQLLKGQKSFNEAATQLLLANVYASQKDYSKALAIYASLDKAGKLSSSSAAAGGAIAEQAGDKKTALHYYQQAVQKARSDKQLSNDDLVQMYQAKVDELGQKQ